MSNCSDLEYLDTPRPLRHAQDLHTFCVGPGRFGAVVSLTAAHNLDRDADESSEETPA